MHLDAGFVFFFVLVNEAIWTIDVYIRLLFLFAIVQRVGNNKCCKKKRGKECVYVCKRTILV